MSFGPPNPPRSPRPPDKLEREESQLWRWALGFMILLAFALSGLLWERLENIPYSLRAIPIGILGLSILFAVYAYGRRQEVSELKGLLHGLQEHVGAAPSEEQLDQLSQVILRSQRNFKELIDSFDDPACAVSLDGTLRTVNKRITDITGKSYSELIGRKIYDFVDEPTQADLETSLGWFLEKKRWAGTVQVRLKDRARPFYFECVLNAIVKGDEVVGVSMLGRDVTEQREKEMRFTELFETLQEGVYFSTPEGHLLDANPALVSMLGYTEKRDLLAVEPAALNFDPGQSVLGRALNDRGGVRTREVKLRRKDGTAAFFLDSSRAVWDTSGNIIRYQGTLVDITEKRKMERQLAQQEEFRSRLLESFPDLILVVDLDERYTFVSSRSRDLLGYEPQRDARKENLRRGRSFPRNGCSLSCRGFGKAGFRFGGIWGAPSRWKLANHARRRQPTGRRRGQDQRSDYLGARHYGRTKTGTADRAERAARGHGRDDRRRCPRAE